MQFLLGCELLIGIKFLIKLGLKLDDRIATLEPAPLMEILIVPLMLLNILFTT